MTVLWSVLFLLGLGILLGLLCAWAAKFFFVAEDPRIKAVEAMLPNYNCGACGKAGCHEMAVALVKGEVKKVTACKAGKKDKNFDPIIAYLSTHPDPDGTKHIPTL